MSSLLHLLWAIPAKVKWDCVETLKYTGPLGPKSYLEEAQPYTSDRHRSSPQHTRARGFKVKHGFSQKNADEKHSIPMLPSRTVSATVSPLVLAEPQNSSVGDQGLNLLKGLPTFQPHLTRSKGLPAVIGTHRNGGCSVTWESCSRLDRASQGSQGTRGSPNLQATKNLIGASSPLHRGLSSLSWCYHAYPPSRPSSALTSNSSGTSKDQLVVAAVFLFSSQQQKLLYCPKPLEKLLTLLRATPHRMTAPLHLGTSVSKYWKNLLEGQRSLEMTTVPKNIFMGRKSVQRPCIMEGQQIECL
ncbi:hypothetical protein EK904_004627 [Melospiza melodia maxima]|nr:hypothetical protein EK904_004627 [Melospiza melodia maxima]